MVDASHPNCRAVQGALASAGLRGTVRILDEPAPSAASAAAQLDVPVGAIANSLVFMTDVDEPVLVMASGAHRVDLDKAARRCGTSTLRRASPAEVRAATGQPIGGVAPVGHPRPLRTLVDNGLADFTEVWAAGGVPQAVFATTFRELVALTSGVPADIT